MELVLSDPTDAPATAAGERLATRFLHDARDIPFLKLMALTSATMIPSGVALFVPGWFSWWLAAAHLAVYLWLVGPFILMLHNTSHRRLFKAPYGRLNYVIPWIIGPFFGESPETYFAHHIGMHHPENNMEADLSSTLGYRRDSARAFARYFGRFFFGVLFELTAYLLRRKRRALAWKCIVGELSYVALAAALCFVDWRASLVVLVLPLVFTRFGMMAGNWGQHAFVDRADPANCYKNSITCINTVYNRRCFNDGYHIGHHIKQTRHWTEMPDDFLRNVKAYEEEGAIVFTGIDFFGVWACLMVKNYRALARRVVQLGGESRSADETIALLKSRTGWTTAS